MLMLAVFFFVMAAINYSIMRMHENKAEALEKEGETLTAQEDIEKNQKRLQQRQKTVKTAKYSTWVLITFGIYMLFMRVP